MAPERDDGMTLAEAMASAQVSAQPRLPLA
jgi:hypothetical protein